MIPDFENDGNLPSGIHQATLDEIYDRFGANQHRLSLLGGLKKALDSLKAAGCQIMYINGSFVTNKELPEDFDACWDPTGVDPSLLDPTLLRFDRGRAAQKTKYQGELFPASLLSGNPGTVFLDFFQTDRDSGERKGIIAIDLRRMS